MDRWMEVYMDKCIDGWILDGWMNRYVDGWMDGWMVRLFVVWIG
jgi:hypothetical protein